MSKHLVQFIINVGLVVVADGHNQKMVPTH